jgi:radical SAM superfamily enzyme YgiQ (UPF0313 family)
MKIALISLNAKYIHTNLAIRYLAECVREAHHTEIFDFTVHDLPLKMAEEIYSYKPDLIGLSVYLWNRDETIRLVKILKRVLPEAFLLLGGPEVMAEPGAFMGKCQEIDAVVQGEGETPFQELVTALAKKTGIETVANITWRKGLMIHRNKQKPPLARMDDIPFPYASEKAWNPNKIYYYESSRGCPFNCSFCMSSLDRAVRSLSWDRVKADLNRILAANIRLVKFVDRTFNWDRQRAFEIWRYLVEHYNADMVFHFEIAADLLDAETIQWLARVPSGYFQFEIGVQSTNECTLKAVQRQTDLTRLFANVQALKRCGNIHLHLDLIVGLPFEDFTSFRESFNRLYRADGHMLQVGFLKLLPGTAIHARASEWDYEYMPDPPYQVLSNHWLSFEDVCLLARVESVFEIYSNTGRFVHALKYLVHQTGDPFMLFLSIAEFWKGSGLSTYGSGMQEHFSQLALFVAEKHPQAYDAFTEVLKFDYFLTGKPGHLPGWVKQTRQISGKMKQWLLQRLTQTVLTHLAEESSAVVRRHTEFAHFQYDVVRNQARQTMYLFDYSQKIAGGQVRWIEVDPLLLQDMPDSDADKGV